MMKRLMLVFVTVFSLCLPVNAEAKEQQIYQEEGKYYYIEDTSISGNQNTKTFFKLAIWSGGDGYYEDIAIINSNGAWVWTYARNAKTGPYYNVTMNDWSGYARKWLASHDHLMY